MPKSLMLEYLRQFRNLKISNSKIWGLRVFNYSKKFWDWRSHAWKFEAWRPVMVFKNVSHQKIEGLMASNNAKRFLTEDLTFDNLRLDGFHWFWKIFEKIFCQIWRSAYFCMEWDIVYMHCMSLVPNETNRSLLFEIRFQMHDRVTARPNADVSMN